MTVGGEHKATRRRQQKRKGTPLDDRSGSSGDQEKQLAKDTTPCNIAELEEHTKQASMVDGKNVVNEKHYDNKKLTRLSSMEAFLHQLPKVELHAHLNGCIKTATLFELAKERKVTLNSYHFREKVEQQSQASVPVIGDEANNRADGSKYDDDDDPMKLLYNVHPRSLKDCFDMFAEIPSCVDDLPALHRITNEALQDFANQGVSYLELRSTPKRLLFKSTRVQSSTASTARDDNQISELGIAAACSTDDARQQEQPNLPTKKDYIATILRAMNDFEVSETERYHREIQHQDSRSQSALVRLPMTCRFLVAMDRSQSIDEAAENVDLAIEFFCQTHPNATANGASRVVGVDLGGNPTKKDFRDFAPIAQRARDAGLRITLHCAEVPCDEEQSPAVDEDEATDSSAPTDQSSQQRYLEAKSLLEFSPDRLGHALLLPPSLRRVLAEMKIPVETCPTSNVMTLELSKLADGCLLHGLKQHPNLPEWLRTHHPLAIGTDDPGVFDTTPTMELLLLSKAFGLSHADIASLVLQSMDYAFCDVETKREVKDGMRRQINQLVRLVDPVRSTSTETGIAHDVADWC